jgi:ribosomal protein S27E
MSTMSITVQCPFCEKPYAFDEKHAGRSVTCKQCGETMLVNSPEVAPRVGPRVRVECDHCGKGHWVSPENAGKKTVCKKCGAMFRIPGGGTASVKSQSAPPSSGRAVGHDPSAPVDLDVFGLEDEPVAPLNRAGSPSDASVATGPAGEDSAPLPARLKPYKPLSEAKKKQIAKRAAKIDRSKASSATVGISFGAVLTFALVGWRIYRVVNGIQRAAGRADVFQSAPADLDAFDPRAAAVETDQEVAAMISQPATAEARDWLDPAKYPKHAVKAMPAQAAREMVAGFYERGAERVYVLEPASINNELITDQFGVKLPQDPVQRKKCLKWAAKCEGLAQPSADVGQKYLLIMTD